MIHTKVALNYQVKQKRSDEIKRCFLRFRDGIDTGDRFHL
jgi:hypothetical protein